MAKSNLFPTASKGILPKVIWTAVLLAILVMVVKHPDNAAVAAKGLAAFLGSAIDGLAAFLQRVAG
jgi:hypothetical protein